MILHLFVFETLIALTKLLRGKNQIIRSEGIDLNLAEFACADLVLKQHVEIGISESLGFWQAEVCLRTC